MPWIFWLCFHFFACSILYLCYKFPKECIRRVLPFYIISKSVILSSAKRHFLQTSVQQVSGCASHSLTWQHPSVREAGEGGCQVSGAVNCSWAPGTQCFSAEGGHENKDQIINDTSQSNFVQPWTGGVSSCHNTGSGKEQPECWQASHLWQRPQSLLSVTVWGVALSMRGSGHAQEVSVVRKGLPCAVVTIPGDFQEKDQCGSEGRG